MSLRRETVRPADDKARALALGLMADARHASLAVIDPETKGPAVSRIAFARDLEGRPLTLISSLASHDAALRANPSAALMIGEPGPKGDPLSHPRLMIPVTAQYIDRADPEYAELRSIYLAQQPKAQLYIHFADFNLVRLVPISALLNGGFGKAWRLEAKDMLA